LLEHRLQRLIGRWFFASSLTGRYTGSPETVMDGDLNRFKGVKDATSFAGALEEMMANELTNDFWTVTLPANLDSSSARNPELFAYIAAQNRLGAPVLFSHKKVQDLLDPAIKTKKKALERHHLFPRAWLESQGVEDLTRINQLANFALLEWPENIDISDTPPAEYVPQIQPRFSTEDWKRMQECHALPDNWHLMPYDTFLIERRKLMAAIIRRGFESLKQAATCDDVANSSTQAAMTPEATESWKTALAGVSSIMPVTGDTKLTETGQLRMEYWTSLIELLKSSGSALQSKEPGPNYWLSLRSPLRGYRCGFEITVRDQNADVFFGSRSEDGIEALRRIQEKDREEIARSVGEKLEWLDQKDKGRFWVMAYRKCDPANKQDWENQQLWLKDTVEKFIATFKPRLGIE
jgi:hypothetical protein